MCTYSVCRKIIPLSFTEFFKNEILSNNLHTYFAFKCTLKYKVSFSFFFGLLSVNCSAVVCRTVTEIQRLIGQKSQTPTISHLASSFGVTPFKFMGKLDRKWQILPSTDKTVSQASGQIGKPRQLSSTKAHCHDRCDKASGKIK